MGLGQIYINLKGREGHGIVSPGTESDGDAERAGRPAADADRSRRRTRAWSMRSTRATTSTADRSSATRRSCRSASPRATACRGRSTLGGSPPGIVYPNMKKWSGDHGSYDYKHDARDADLEPAAAGRRQRRHHGHRADGVEVLRRADTVRYRWKADLLRAGNRSRGLRFKACGAQSSRNALMNWLCDLCVLRVDRRDRCSVRPAQPDRGATEALARRAAERCRRCSARPTGSPAEERTLLGDLRKLEVEREIKAEELKQAGRRQRPRCRQSSRQTAAADRRRWRRGARPSVPELRARLVETLQARPGALPPPAALDRRSPAHRPGDAHGRRARQDRSRSHRGARSRRSPS